MAQRGLFCALREFVLEGEVEVVALVVVAPGLAAEVLLDLPFLDLGGIFLGVSVLSALLVLVN